MVRSADIPSTARRCFVTNEPSHCMLVVSFTVTAGSIARTRIGASAISAGSRVIDDTNASVTPKHVMFARWRTGGASE